MRQMVDEGCRTELRTNSAKVSFKQGCKDRQSKRVVESLYQLIRSILSPRITILRGIGAD